jgi:hypothetical protein
MKIPKQTIDITEVVDNCNANLCTEGFIRFFACKTSKNELK